MRKIILPKGKYALVDDEDFNYLNQWKWHLSQKGYVIRRRYKTTNEFKNIWMHRLINKTPDGFDTDHINRNKLDNRKCNLRAVTHAENMRNQKKYKSNTSGVVGVHWQKEIDKWRVRISFDGKRISLGIYDSIEDAVLARKEAEKKYNYYYIKGDNK